MVYGCIRLELGQTTPKKGGVLTWRLARPAIFAPRFQSSGIGSGSGGSSSKGVSRLLLVAPEAPSEQRQKIDTRASFGLVAGLPFLL